EITVQVNDDKFDFIKLPLDAKLTEIRKTLSANSDIRMGDKVNFLNSSRKYDPKMPREYEETYNLKAILGCDNILKISGTIEPDWPEIIRINSLEYGVFFKKDGPVHAEKKKAYKIKQYPKSILAKPDIRDEEKVCRTGIDEFYLKNFFVTTKVGGKLPYLPSIDGTYISRSETHCNVAEFDKYNVKKSIKAVFNMTKAEIEPTVEFVSAVEAALESEDRYQSLKKVTEEFGEYWCEQVKIGGSILYVSKKEARTKEAATTEDVSTSTGLNFPGSIEAEGSTEKNKEKKTSNSQEREYSFIKIRGGSEEEFYDEGGFPKWLKSLKNYKKWSVVKYSKVHSIFDILGEDIQKEVAKEFKKRIVYSKVINIDNFKMDLSEPEPYVYEFPKNIDLSNTQIFITEMNDNKSDTIFASRVHYYKNKEQPVILLHRLGKLKKQQSFRTFSVKLGLILIGTSTRLNLLGQSLSQLEFENGEEQINNMNIIDDKYSAEISKHRMNINKTSLLATFVSKSKDSQINPYILKHIVRAHFVNDNENGSIKACAFCYNLESRKLDYSNKDVEFLINYSIISQVEQHQTAKLGLAQIKNKFTKSISRRLTHSKRFDVLFDDYSNLPQNNDQGRPCLENPIFVNLLLNKCPQNCPHGVFNITRDHAAFKTIIDNSSLQNATIAYFSVSTFEGEE
ncbi:7923_t:CDS:2, partial [Ambispora leptoticha]